MKKREILIIFLIILLIVFFIYFYALCKEYKYCVESNYAVDFTITQISINPVSKPYYSNYNNSWSYNSAPLSNTEAQKLLKNPKQYRDIELTYNLHKLSNKYSCKNPKYIPVFNNSIKNDIIACFTNYHSEDENYYIDQNHQKNYQGILIKTNKSDAEIISAIKKSKIMFQYTEESFLDVKKSTTIDIYKGNSTIHCIPSKQQISNLNVIKDVLLRYINIFILRNYS